MEIGLQLQQTQKLIITPELRQAIEILQLSTIDLVEFSNQALTENPLLESVEPETQGETNLEGVRRVDWESYVRTNREYRDNNQQQQEITKDTYFESMPVDQLTLEEYLNNQWRFMVLEPEIHRIGSYMIGNLNSSGYLNISIAQIAADLSCPEDQVMRALRQVQTLDPTGVCARDLRECLLIQLERQEIPEDEKKLLITLVDNYLEEIGKGGLVRIAKELAITPAVVQGLVDEIKKLNPKPGVSFSDGDRITYIVPDVVIEREEEGEGFRIVLSESYLPRLTVNRTYAKVLLSEAEADKEAKTFIENKLNQASWLMRCFAQRSSTIQKVTEALLVRQRGFFENGVSDLRPLTMREIAEDVGVHESTISRTAANKYIQTPHGVFEYKFLFSPGLESQGGENISTETIRAMIRSVIENEPSDKPYSDHQTALLLGEKGVRIARRTVAKYREEMGIPSTALRRRYE